MNRRRRIRWILLIAVVAVVAAACSSDSDDTTTTAADGATTTAAAADEGSIWVLLPDSASSARWETDDRPSFDAALTAAGVEFNIVNAEGDAQQQVAQAEQAIAAGAKVILLTNLDSASGATIIQIARDAGVKVVDYDRLTVEGDGADVYVSFNNVAVGEEMCVAMEPAIDALGLDAVKVVLLNGGPTDNNSGLFKEGYTSCVDRRVAAGDWEVVADEDTPDWDNQEALRIMEQVITSTGGDFQAVFAANDGLANSTIAALLAAGDDTVPLSGQDATVAGMQNVLAGFQTMSVYKAIKAEAEAASAVAVALLRGASVDSITLSSDFIITAIDNGTNEVPYVALTPVAVTVDNIAETVIADGFRTWDEICVGDFEEFCPADR